MACLQLTALIAVGISVELAYREKLRLERHKASLARSSPLLIDNEEQFGSARLPRIASGFQSWDIHAPAGNAYELYLGVGDVAYDIIATIIDSVPVSSGRHRITLRAQDSPGDEFHFAVYVDGIEKLSAKMGRSWLPNGWVRTSDLRLPRKLESARAPMQLAGICHKPKYEFGSGREDLQDSSITRRGYRLWIDHADQSYPSPSDLFQLSSRSSIQSIGIRDGLRFQDSKDWQWYFLRPSLESQSRSERFNRRSAYRTARRGGVWRNPS